MNTFYVIVLGLILSTIIGLFFILYFEIKGIKSTLYYIANCLQNIDKINLTNNKHIEHLLDRFNKRILINEEYFNIIKDLLNNRFKDVDNATDSIYDRINAIGSNTQNLINAEHKYTRKEITKQAKISSKIKSQSKTKKNTNNTRKCE